MPGESGGKTSHSGGAIETLRELLLVQVTLIQNRARRAVVHVVAGALLGVLALSILAVAGSRIVGGLAGALSALTGTPWLGDLLSGGVIILLIALSLWSYRRRGDQGDAKVGLELEHATP